ncbi:MAG: hypothetical protein MUF13_04210, partial [Akkermansiaceae bacterium]|nr:hypothetical protein [Akkermansiaceae bacterium]
MTPKTYLPALGCLIVGLALGRVTVPKETVGRTIKSEREKSTRAVATRTHEGSHPTHSPTGPPIEQSSGVYSAITDCPQNELNDMAERILSLRDDSPHRLAALDLLMERWVSINPTEALAFAYSLRGADRDEAFKSALLRLGQSQFSETMAWMTANMTIAARSNAQIWLYCGLARTDPLASLKEIEALEHGKLKEDALFNVVSEWAQVDLKSAFDWYETAPWNSKMPEVYQRLMDVYIRNHPEHAKTFVAQMDEGNYWKRRYTEDLAVSMAEKDPATAYQLSKGLTNATDQERALNHVFEKWAQEDPKEALSAAFDLSTNQNVETSTINDVFRQAAFGMLWEDLDAIHENYNKFPEDIRRELVGPMVKQWMENDPVAASQWAASNPKDSPDYNLAMSSVASYYEQWDPETGIAMANKITYDDIKG